MALSEAMFHTHKKNEKNPKKTDILIIKIFCDLLNYFNWPVLFLILTFCEIKQNAHLANRYMDM